MCETVGAEESTTYCCPRGLGTSLACTRIKSECPAQARTGEWREFQMTGVLEDRVYTRELNLNFSQNKFSQCAN